MPLGPGTRIGAYEVLSKLGEGGMGEVYRARDTRLDRDVALKILPAAFAADPDRLARFDREAKALAALNHPNIAAIHGVEQNALVMEFVEGLDLSAHIARGPMALDDAIAIARQIVDALEAAHESGIVHRDLKPANVKVRPDGTVKILDFGLAKALTPDTGPGTADAQNSPTLTARATQLGMILGTAAYMSPEQAKGRAVDKRADIWAFGVVLYEMLTGRRAFDGEDVSTTMAAVLMRDPDWAALPEATPVALRKLIRRCLERDPKVRLRDIGDARIELSAVDRDPPVALESQASPPRSRVLVGALALVAVAAAGVAAWSLLKQEAPGIPLQLSIALPDGHNLVSGPAVSRDGRRVAFVSRDGIARPRLYVRDLDQPAARALPDTEEAADPFFSPDGSAIAFYARNRLLKIDVTSGTPVPLADSTSSAGGTWTDAGTIIFKRAWNGGLHVVDQNGGEPAVLIAADKDDYAYTWPYARPRSGELFFTSWGKAFNITHLDIATKTKRVVSPGWRRFVVTASGHIIGVNEAGGLQAVSLDGAAGDGRITTVLEGVDIGTAVGDARFDVSETGTLVYVPANSVQRRLVTVDRQGQVTRSSLLPEAEYDELRLSPSGRFAAVVSKEKLSIVDLERGTVTPLVPELGDRGARSTPVWSLDGATITFASNHEGNWEIYSKSATGAGDIVPVLKRPLDQFAGGYAPDGTLVYWTIGPETGTDLWLRDPKGDTRAWLATSAQETDAQFSPDGRFIAYSSNESGRPEIYVQPRDNPTERLQVSATSGSAPVWSPKGVRLFFRSGTAMMEATITSSGKLAASAPVQIFNNGWTLPPAGYDAAPSGDPFVMIEQPATAIRNRIDVVLNWFIRLEEKMRPRK